jgi:hypothetical protein
MFYCYLQETKMSPYMHLESESILHTHESQNLLRAKYLY